MSPLFGSLQPAKVTFDEVARRARSAPPPARVGERCDMCGEPVESDHHHVVDLTTSEVMCACRPCSLLFDHDAAGGDHFRRMPDDRRPVGELAYDDAAWETLGVPVGLAFFLRRSGEGGVAAIYPGPAGTVEGSVSEAAWQRLVASHPALSELTPDVQGLLVNRARTAREAWIVPVADCYRLAGILRQHWEGMNGGDEVWHQVDQFFAGLSGRKRSAQRPGGG